MEAIFANPQPRFYTDDHTAPAAFTFRTFSVPANAVLIRNTDTAQTVIVSLNASGSTPTNGITLNPGECLVVDTVNMVGYWTKRGGGTPAVEVLFGSGQ